MKHMMGGADGAYEGEGQVEYTRGWGRWSIRGGRADGAYEEGGATKRDQDRTETKMEEGGGTHGNGERRIVEVKRVPNRPWGLTSVP